MARGPKEINWKEVESAMMASENQDEIAASQGVTRQTLRDRFMQEFGTDYLSYSQALYKKGNALLREAQMKSAMKGNSNMLLWLGKVRLDQKEPDGALRESPRQNEISYDHEIMKLKNLLTKNGISYDDDKPKTEPEFCGSDPQV